MAGYGTIMFLLQNQQSKLALRNIHPTLLILEQSIHQLDLLELFAFSKISKHSLCFVVLHVQNAPMVYMNGRKSTDLVSLSGRIPYYFINYSG